MNTNIKRYFASTAQNLKTSSLDEKGRILVESGIEAVKKYVAEKEGDGNQKRNFADLISGVETNDRKVFDNKLVSKLVKYSLEKAGVMTDKNFDVACIADPMLHNKTIFKETFNAVIAQIMTPIIPAMVSARFMDWADISNIGWGDTARFLVHSNDTFYVNRFAEGILDGSVQRIYNNEITVNPEPYTIKTTVDWYQIAAGVYDFGEFVYRIGNSYSAYITQMIIGALQKNITTGFPTAYFVNGFATTTFANLADILRAANGGANIRAYGTLPALSQVIPESAKYPNMQFGISEEWAKVGFVDKYMDVDLMRIPQILLPNTVNTNPLVGVPNNIVYMFADGGYRPVKIVFEGSALTLDIIPTDSPDKEMGIQTTLRMGSTFVVASKFGAITLA